VKLPELKMKPHMSPEIIAMKEVYTRKKGCD
jgi:hypothetical protein